MLSFFLDPTKFRVGLGYIPRTSSPDIIAKKSLPALALDNVDPGSSASVHTSKLY